MPFRTIAQRGIAIALVLLLAVSALPLTAFAAYENTHVNTGNQAVDLVSVALTQVGYVEGANNANKYAESYGSPNQPWCGFFISWCARQAGIPTAVIPDSGLSSAFKNIGTFHARTSGYTPQMGDIMMYDYDGDGSPEHVSIVEKYTASTSTVTVVDGNWSDKVSRHTAAMSDGNVLGFTTPTYTTKITELTAINLVKPSVVLKGKSFSISGSIYSDVKITKVSVTVTDANGAKKIDASATPNAKSYDLKGLDAKIKFGSLAEGEYSFVITASDSSGDTKRWTSTFRVVTSIPLTITELTVPSAIAAGKTFSIGGLIECIENITTVAVGIYDDAGVYKTGGTANPNTTSYNIKGVDKYVSFGSLTAGHYTMRVTARSANGEAMWEYPFTVGVDTEFTVTDEIVPTALITGDDFTVGGIVTSTTPLSIVSINILDKDGNRLYYANLTPYAYSADIAEKADELDFSVLEAGDYIFRIGMLSGNANDERRYPFTVSDPAGFETIDIVAPTVLTEGDSFTIGGKVTSPVPFDTVSVNILDANGNRLYYANARPENSCEVDIGTLASQLNFAVLPAGAYTFRIGLLSERAHDERLYPFTVEPPLFCHKPYAYPTMMTVGENYTVDGVVDAVNPLNAVTVGVLDADGNALLKTTANPSTQKYDYSALASKLDFSSLPAGQYVFRVGVRSGTDRDEFLKEFRVVEAPATDKPGDVTLDSRVNMQDVMMLYQHTSGRTVMAQSQYDRVGIETVNMITAAKLYRYVSERSTVYP